MSDAEPNKNGGPLGGEGKIVEASETVVGGKSKNRAYRDAAPKKAVQPNCLVPGFAGAGSV